MVAENQKLADQVNALKIQTERLLEDYKQKELQKYESEIKNSSKTIKKKQEELQEITMSIDSLFGLVSTTDTIVNIDTFKSKKTSWLKKQINKLKYEKSKN